MLEDIKIGVTNKIEKVVTEENTAAAAGSGALPVVSTPSLISRMEQAAFTLLKKEPISQESVGISISVQHVRATLTGTKVWAIATVTAVDRRKVDFEVVAYDQEGEIGKGIHSRFCIDREKFLNKLNSK